MRFKNKVAFITGGARGIGEAYARALVAEGAAVALPDIEFPAAQETAASINKQGGQALALECDVADEGSVERAVAQTVKTFGGIDILINNAAKHLMEYSVPLTELPREKWRRMLAVNVVGIVNCSAACRPPMKARGGGVIINQASISGYANTTSPYGISKLAVRGLTVGLAHEFASDNIRVYCIAPGIVDSPAAMADVPADMRNHFVQNLQLIKRPGKMSDLVSAMLFFCSEEASFITGEALVIAGGFPTRL